MDVIGTFMWEYRFFVVVAVAAVVYFIFDRQKATTKLYALMLTAKRLAQKAVIESGEAEAEWVFQKAKLVLPPMFLMFISDEKLRMLIKFLFDKAKDYVDDGEINDTNGNHVVSDTEPKE